MMTLDAVEVVEGRVHYNYVSPDSCVILQKTMHISLTFIWSNI